MVSSAQVADNVAPDLGSMLFELDGWGVSDVMDKDKLGSVFASTDTLQERMRALDDAEALHDALRAVGAPDPEGLLGELLSRDVERQTGYVLVPVAWDVGNLAAHRDRDRDEVSLFMLDERLMEDAEAQCELFRSAEFSFDAYLGLWADELNRRGDELFEEDAKEGRATGGEPDEARADEAETEKLTPGLARFIASLECTHELAIDCMRPEELLGIPLIASDVHDKTYRRALLSAVASVADILLHGTWLERLRRELEDLKEDDAPDARGSDCCSDADSESPPPDDGMIEVHGQHFYPHIEAQELGAAWYLNGCGFYAQAL